MKKTVLTIIMVISTFAIQINAQVGINTANPQGAFNIDAAKDNAATGVPTAAQQANDVSVTATGSVGIGTTAPAAKVDIVGTMFGMKSSTASGSWDNIWFNVTPSIPSINVSGAESGLQFNVGANSVGTYGDGQTLTTVATMLSNGNMGVGTTTPATKFHVEGAEVRLTNATSLWGLDPEGTSPTSQFSIVNRTGNVRQLILQENGNAFLGGSLSTGGGNAAISAVGGSVGIGNNAAPTNTLDVNGTTRVRTVNQAAGTTLISPVYVDPTGVLVKGSPSTTYGGFRSNTVSIAAGASGSLVTGLPEGAYRVTVLIFNGCNDIATADFFVHNISLNGFFALNGQHGLVSSSGGNATFTQSVRNTVAVTWPSVAVCADTGNGTAFNYTITLPSAGTINVTNNGNVTRGYRISLTRMD